MSATLEQSVAELRSLPEGRVREVADFIRRLREEEHDRRVAWLNDLGKSLSNTEVDDWEKAVMQSRRDELPSPSARW